MAMGLALMGLAARGMVAAIGGGGGGKRAHLHSQSGGAVRASLLPTDGDLQRRIAGRVLRTHSWGRSEVHLQAAPCQERRCMTCVLCVKIEGITRTHQSVRQQSHHHALHTGRCASRFARPTLRGSRLARLARHRFLVQPCSSTIQRVTHVSDISTPCSFPPCPAAATMQLVARGGALAPLLGLRAHPLAFLRLGFELAVFVAPGRRGSEQVEADGRGGEAPSQKRSVNRAGMRAWREPSWHQPAGWARGR